MQPVVHAAVAQRIFGAWIGLSRRDVLESLVERPGRVAAEDPGRRTRLRESGVPLKIQCATGGRRPRE